MALMVKDILKHKRRGNRTEKWMKEPEDEARGTSDMGEIILTAAPIGMHFYDGDTMLTPNTGSYTVTTSSR